MSEQLISLGESQRFYSEGLEQLNHLLIGEHEAKVGMMVAMVSGLNVVLVGEPGGGKTTLAANAHRIIEGISDEDVATVPPQSDLIPQQLIGGTTKVTRTTEQDGETAVETTAADINALIRPSTKVIFANEINRINPYALNGILEAFESGVLVTTAGTSYLNDLEYAVSTMNPSDNRRQGTFPVSAAATSRHALGVELGAHRADREDLVGTIFAGEGESNPDKVETVISLHGLHAMRVRANEATAIPKALHRYGTHLIVGAVDSLKDNDIREADIRMTKQIRKIAKAHALLNGQEAVDEADIRQAVRFALTARLGILGMSGQTSVSDKVNGIINNL